MVRQSGADPENIRFRDILMRFRDGQSTEADWITLLQHTPANISNPHEFTNAIHLFYKKEEVAKYNHQAISKLGSPIAKSMLYIHAPLQPPLKVMMQEVLKQLYLWQMVQTLPLKLMQKVMIISYASTVVPGTKLGDIIHLPTVVLKCMDKKKSDK